MAIGSLILAALHIQQRFVQAQQRYTQCHHFFARGVLRSAVVGGVEVGCAHAWRTAPCAKFIVRYNAADFQSVKGSFFTHGSAVRPPAAESAGGFGAAAVGTWRRAYTRTEDFPAG